MLTSDFEGFGLVIVEAMQFGVVPVVYGSYLAVYDIIEDGKNGIITPMPYNIDNTVGSLRKLMDDSNLRQQMATNAIVKAKKFSVDNVVNEWYEKINQLTKQ